MELAYNVNGEPFEVPAHATHWRVRKIKPKGAPEVVYSRDGVPLLLPIDADIEALREDIDGSPGRYRVDALDGNGRAIEGASGYVMIHSGAQRPSTPASAASASDSALIEAMRINAELARAVIERFPAMMESAAQLVRAADGAGLPARPPMAYAEVYEDAESDDDTADERAGFDVRDIVTQLLPLVLSQLGTRKRRSDGALDRDDQARALAAPAPAPTPLPATKAPQAHAAPPPASRSEASAPGTPPAQPPAHAATRATALTAATLAHIAAVQAQLTPEEADLARIVAQELPPDQLQAWFNELATLSVAAAAQRVRTALQLGAAA